MAPLINAKGLLPDYGYSQTVHYDSRNHFSIMSQLYGSIWQAVLPHCLANVALTTILLVLLFHYDTDYTINEYGHEFMSVLVAFLLCGRFSLTLGLYFELRGFLSGVYRATVEVVQLGIAFSPQDNSAARQWRGEVAYHALLLLRTFAAMLTRSNRNGVDAWDISELGDAQRAQLRRTVAVDCHATQEGDLKDSIRRPSEHAWSFDNRGTAADENLRVPLRLAQQLRAVITHHPPHTIDSIQEMQLLQCVNRFMEGYYNIRKYLVSGFSIICDCAMRTSIF